MSTAALNAVPNHPMPVSIVEVNSGAKLDLNEPDPALIKLDDISRALVLMPRYIGHAQENRLIYSQAMHSMWVAYYLMNATSNPVLALQGLLFDAHKAYIGDIPRPTIEAILIGPQLKALETRFRIAVFQAFDLPALTPDCGRWISQAKAQAKRAEADTLLLSGGLDWGLPEQDKFARDLGFIPQTEPWITEFAYQGHFDNLKKKGHL